MKACYTKSRLTGALCRALGALGTISTVVFPITAHAVHLSPNGLGQVLIFPYYTARTFLGGSFGSYNTLLSIVNTSDDTKALKVRFLEGARGAQVMSFNLFLAPRDT